MRYVIGFLGVFALSLMLSFGCSEVGGEGGSGGTAGNGGMGGGGGTGGGGGVGGTGGTMADDFPCTERGIRDAIAEGGGPHTFACDGPTTVVTEAKILIDNDVILDGEGNLIIDGGLSHTVIEVAGDVTVGLRALTVTGGRSDDDYAGGITTSGALQLSRVSIQDNACGSSCFVAGIFSISGVVTISDSAITGNKGSALAASDATLTNVTIAGNTSAPGGLGGTIWSLGSVTLVNCTVSEVEAFVGGRASEPPILLGTLIEGDCGRRTVSNGYNIEAPGDTCGFDQATDQVNVTSEDLKLGPLQDNGGPTMTHALGAGSIAIDQIPEVDCVDSDGAPLTTDQRGEPRPGGTMCDVGAFEAQP